MGIIPPKFMQENARKALEAIEEGESDAMLRVGRIRARQLAEGKALSPGSCQRSGTSNLK